MNQSGIRTGDGLVSLRGGGQLTGQRASAHYRPEAEGLLLGFTPLPTPEPERLSGWTDKLAGTPPVDLLTELHERFGVEWRRIAQLVGVSVTAVNKWRGGGGVAAESNLALRRLVGFCELATAAGVFDVAGWLASNPVEQAVFTRADLYSVGAAEHLLESLERPLPGEALLDHCLPRWREAVRRVAFSPVLTIDDDGAVILELPELPGVIAVADTEDEARARLLVELRDYATEWDRFADAPDHVQNQELVQAVLAATTDDDLYRLVFPGS
jgi:hypothetical protein